MTESALSVLEKIEIVPFPAGRIIGKPGLFDLDNPGEAGKPAALWERCFADGTFDTLKGLGDAALAPDYVGYMDMRESPGAGRPFMYYLVGMRFAPGTPAPAGFAFQDLPAGDVAICYINGKPPKIFWDAHVLSERAIRERHPERAYAEWPWSMEVYNCPRFTVPRADGSVVLDYYMPVLD